MLSLEAQHIHEPGSVMWLQRAKKMGAYTSPLSAAQLGGFPTSLKSSPTRNAIVEAVRPQVGERRHALCGLRALHS